MALEAFETHRYFSKADAKKGKYDCLTSPIFQEWGGSGFEDFRQEGDKGIRFKHKASGIELYVHKDRPGNVVVDLSEASLQVWQDLAKILQINLVDRTPIVSVHHT